MRLSLVRDLTPFRPARSALVAAALLAALGLILVVLPESVQGPVACPFRAVTGLPCPTCGLIRAARSIADGGIAEAFRINPFDAAFLLFVAPAFLVVWIGNLLGGVAVRFSMSRAERIVGLCLLAVALAANWVYVLRTGL